MNKNGLALSIIFFGLCVVVSSWFISDAIKKNHQEGVDQLEERVTHPNRYEYIQVSGNYEMIFDRHTGNYWSNLNGQGWEKNVPISNSEEEMDE